MVFSLSFDSSTLELIHLFRFVKDSKDGKTARELKASERVLLQYEVTIVTGSVANAGTDANVSIVLFGDKVYSSLFLFHPQTRVNFKQGDSGLKKLERSGNLFEKGKLDVFCFDIPDIGKSHLLHTSKLVNNYIQVNQLKFDLDMITRGWAQRGS